jgi:uncharacterized repeat protein (TIGR01451 family)
VTGASVADTFPAGFTLSGNWTCTATAGSSCGAASGTGNIGTTVSLVSGGSATFGATGTAGASGTLTNTATVTAPAGVTDPNTGNNSATDTTTITSTPQANLGITKTDGLTGVAPGGSVPYAIVVSNAGPSAVTGAPVTDTFPAGFTLSGNWTCTASAGSSCGAASGTGNIGTTVSLLSGGSATFSATGTAGASGTLTNTATVATPAGVTDPNTGNNSATDTTSITPSSSVDLLYFSTEGNVTVPGVGGTADDADIYAWQGASTYRRVFDATANDGPDNSLGGADIDALLVVDDDTFYVSFRGAIAVPAAPSTNGALPGIPRGFGAIDDSDIVKYDAGVNPTNPWSVHFDGSDVGLTNDSEDVDAFEILADGSVVISANGPTAPATTPVIDVTGVTGEDDSDLLRCAGTFGATTTCTWTYYFDGSDVALTADGEDVDGASVASGNLYLTTTGAFGVSGLSGADEDVFVCNSPTTGAVTACGSFTLFYDGSANGITDDLDAIDVPGAAPPPGPQANLGITKTDGLTSVAPGGTVPYTIVVSNAGPSNVTGASVADTFPAGFTLSGNWTCTASAGSSCGAASGTGNIGTTVSLLSGGSATFGATGTAGASGTLTNTATVTAPAGVTDPTPGNNSATDTTTITSTPQANLGITKTDGLTSVAPGGTVPYTIVVSNAGPSNVTGASVADTFPAGFTLSGNWTCTASAGSSCGAASGTGNIGTTVSLLSGGSATFSATGTAGASGTLTNTATVTAPAGVTDPTPGNNSATDTTTIGAVPADLIFEDGFESGNTSAWSAEQDGEGDLNVTAAAALNGAFGLAALIDNDNADTNTTAMYVRDDSPTNVARYRARFYFDPNGITMAGGDLHVFMTVLNAAGVTVARLEFQRSTGGSYQVRAGLRNDGDTFTNTGFFTISDAPHRIEIDWQAATSAGANNGSLRLWIDGTSEAAPAATLSGVDNDTRRAEQARLGPQASIDPETLGTYYFDAFVSRRTTFIGP